MARGIEMYLGAYPDVHRPTRNPFMTGQSQKEMFGLYVIPQSPKDSAQGLPKEIRKRIQKIHDTYENDKSHKSHETYKISKIHKIHNTCFIYKH